jgi:hypothetical protein
VVMVQPTVGGGEVARLVAPAIPVGDVDFAADEDCRGAATPTRFRQTVPCGPGIIEDIVNLCILYKERNVKRR